MSELVKFKQENGVATITLNRPERLNAWNLEFVEQLANHIDTSRSPEVRTVIITGAGRAFSSGADLKTTGELLAGSDKQSAMKPSQILSDHHHPMLLSIMELDKPVIAAVNGPAVGIGLSLALICDVVIAKQSATLMAPFVSIGLVPDGGLPALLPSLVGRLKGMEIALFGEPISAEQAAEIGLITRCVADQDFEVEVERVAQRFAVGPTVALAGAKKAINASSLPKLKQALNLEAELQDNCVTSQDFVEGVTAFLQKREPAFAGK